nr:putative DUF998 domain-containing protein [uncultured bacterium]
MPTGTPFAHAVPVRRVLAVMQRAAIGGVVGPVTFITAWMIAGMATSRAYSPIDDAISRLAAVGADTRWLMTAGFVVFGFALASFGQALRTQFSGSAWITSTITGLATLGVAATPLDWSDGVDRLHGVFAGLGYVTLALTPMLAATTLFRSGRTWLAGAGCAAGLVSTVALGLTLTDLPTGLVQRIGLTATDAWIIALAVMMLSERRAAQHGA